MKKNISKIFALLLALMMALSLAACGNTSSTPSSNPTQPGGEQTQQPGNEPDNSGDTTDWSHFEDWTDEDWDGKSISYQFTGDWALEEQDIYDYFVINLYSDGSALAEQYNAANKSNYKYFGYWSEEDTGDGNEISLDTVYVTPNGGVGALVVHEYHYDLYEESDGGYSFGFTFGLAAGAYFRDCDVAGSSTVTYATVAEFEAGADSIFANSGAAGGEGAGDEESSGEDAGLPEIYRFVNTEDQDGFSAVVSVKEDNSVVATLYVMNEGNLANAHEDYGTLNGDTLVIADVEIPLTANGDGSFGDFSLTIVWDTIGRTFEFTMTQDK